MVIELPTLKQLCFTLIGFAILFYFLFSEPSCPDVALNLAMIDKNNYFALKNAAPS
jgi:hypothetical protein